MASIAGNVTPGVRWIVDSSGQIVGYRNPVTDQDNAADFGGGSGGIAASSGSDMTAATLNSYGVATYTAGAKWVVTYDGSGMPLTEYLLGDAALKSDLTEVGDGIYVVSSGLKHVSGALCMTLAQRNTWTALVPATTQIEVGFRVFVTDVGSIIDASGNVIVPGAHCVWAGNTLGWLWEGSVRYTCYQAGTTTNFASGALATSRQVDVPAGVAGPYSRVRTYVNWEFTGTVGTKAVQTQINGTAIFSASTSASAHLNYTVGKSLIGMGPSAQRYVEVSQNGDLGGSKSALMPSTSIDFSTTALAVTFKSTMASGETATARHVDVCVLDELNAF